VLHVVRALAPLLCACTAGCSLGSFNAGALACGPDDGGPICPSGTACYCNICSAAQPASCCVPEAASAGGLTPRYGLSLVYVGGQSNYLLAIGGFDSCGQPSDLIEAYNLSSSSGGWLPAASSIGTANLPTPAGSLGAAVLSTNGAVIAAGGAGPGGVLLSTVEINPFTPHAWALAANLPSPLAQPAMALNVFDGCLYVVGGVSGSGSSPQQSSDIEQLCNPLQASATWSSVGSLSCGGATCPISGAVAVYSPFDLNVYVLGGLSGSAALSSGEIVASGGLVSPLAAQTLSGHINGGAAFAAPSSLYLMGGLPAPGESPSSTVETLDLSDADAGWSSVEDLPTALSDFGAASDSQGNVYVAGGRTVGADGGWRVVGSLEVYTSGSWTTEP
jgi:hypothetical protein